MIGSFPIHRAFSPCKSPLYQKKEKKKDREIRAESLLLKLQITDIETTDFIRVYPWFRSKIFLQYEFIPNGFLHSFGRFCGK